MYSFFIEQCDDNPDNNRVHFVCIILAVHHRKNAALGAAATMFTRPQYTGLRSPRPVSSTLFSGITGTFGKHRFGHQKINKRGTQKYN
jgi:hypothetical protein